jgi:hypothetical protein
LKKILLLFVLISSLSAQETIKKDEKAPFTGKLITMEQYDRLIERSMKLDIYEKELDPLQADQIKSLTAIILLKNQIIEDYMRKYNAASARLSIIETENKRLRFSNNILIITNNIGWTISLGYTGGIIAFAVVKSL